MDDAFRSREQALENQFFRAVDQALFARLQAERYRVQRNYSQSLGLSAGMSGDLEIAVQHGSTCVRVGTAVRRPAAAD